MLIGICGGKKSGSLWHGLMLTPPGICAGKSAVALYLINEHGFRRLHLARKTPRPSIERSASNSEIPDDNDYHKDGGVTSFPDAASLLDFVTANWRERWVTTDIWDEGIVDVLLGRPFSLLISVDAPITLRWERFKARYEMLQLGNNVRLP
jgi:dCMP deaminase